MVVTKKGYMARLVAKFRPNVPVSASTIRFASSTRASATLTRAAPAIAVINKSTFSLFGWPSLLHPYTLHGNDTENVMLDGINQPSNLRAETNELVFVAQRSSLTPPDNPLWPLKNLRLASLTAV